MSIRKLLLQAKLLIRLLLESSEVFVEHGEMETSQPMAKWRMVVSSRQYVCTHHPEYETVFIKNGMTRLILPPYSLNLSPCDFFVPPNERVLKGIRFAGMEEVKKNDGGIVRPILLHKNSVSALNSKKRVWTSALNEMESTL